MIVDGATHAMSDLSGLGRGFRDSNDLAADPDPAAPCPCSMPVTALGSFNSWARLITGILAGVGIVWFAFPHLERSFAQD